MLGADDYMHKPFSMDRLVQRVQELLAEPFADGKPADSEHEDSEPAANVQKDPE